MKELKIICWSSGIFGIVCLVIGLTLHPEKGYLPHPNFFIKNAPDIFYLNICLFLYAIPRLMEHVAVNDDPFNNKYCKAKINFIGSSILMPGTVLLLFALYLSNEIVPVFVAILSLVIFVYLVFFCQLFVQMINQKKRNRNL